MSATTPIKVFAGSASQGFATSVCKYLALPLGVIETTRFADGEYSVQILENVRGCDVFLIQSTCTPVNEHLMELFLIMDALRRASVHRITAVIPYYGYARQDRKTKPRVPISAALVAQLLEAAGANRVLAVDLHCGQIQGFFRIPVDNLFAIPVFLKDVLKNMRDLQNVVIVSPDAGGMERAERFRQALEAEGAGSSSIGVAIINKKREQANKVSSMELVGSVEGADVIIVDDLVDTAGTLCKAAELLKEKGAKRVFAMVTHPLLSGPAVPRIEASALDQLVVADTIPLPPTVGEKKDKDAKSKIRQISVAPLVGEAIRRVHNSESVSGLFV
jgi:ribose-phosphate pyrophosphokinase